MWQRYYMGVGICSMGIDINQHYYDDATDKIVKMSVKSSSSYTVTEGFYFPFSKAGKEGSVGLDLASTVNLFNYNVGTVNYSSETVATETGFCYQAIVPFALVYKSGGEAILNKKSKFLFTCGAGIAPSYAITKVFSPGLSFSARKFIMAEMGYHAGIAFKLRATAYFGKMTLVNAEGDDFFYTSSFKSTGYGVVDNTVTGKTGITLTLALMPFSWAWAKKDDFDYSN